MVVLKVSWCGIRYLMLRCGVLTPAQILLVFGLAHERDPLAKAFCHPALRWLGKLSYPVYMLQVRKTPSWPRSWASQPFIAVFPQEFMGQLASFGPT